MASGVTENRQDPPTGSRGELQHALFRVLKSLVFRGDPRSPLNEMPISQLKCLHIVGDSEGQKMIDIAHKMEIGLPAVSQIVDRLVRRGLLERQPDLQDRRVVRVVLTASARALMADAHRHRQERMDATLARLGGDETEFVARGLERLAVAAEEVEAGEKQYSAVSGPDESAEASLRAGGDPLVELISERSRSRRKGRSAESLLPTLDQRRP